MKDFSIDFWVIAENNLCDQQKYKSLTRFVHHINIFLICLILYILNVLYFYEFGTLTNYQK